MLENQLMDEGQVALYLKEKNLYPQATALVVEDLHAIKESVEGYVNQIYRITGPGRTMVLKKVQQLPVSRCDEVANGTADAHLKDWSLDMGRMRVEISVLIYWNEVYPGICPEIYLFDEPQGIIVMEDLTDLSLLRFDFTRLKKHPLLAQKLGTFMARNLFFSSDLYLTTFRRRELLSFFENPEYSALDPFLFEECVIVSDHRTMPAETWPQRLKVLKNPVAQGEIMRLRKLFLTSKECLIHTDLHASNIMVGPELVKIIDTEFAGFGPIAQDFGRLMGSFCLNFFSWYGDDGVTSQGEGRDYQAYLLETLCALYTQFEEEFTRLCQAHRADSYTLKQLDLKAYLSAHLRDALSFTALNAASRIGDRGMSHDLARLSVPERIYPQRLILTMCDYLLTAGNSMATISDFTSYLRTLSTNYPKDAF